MPPRTKSLGGVEWKWQDDSNKFQAFESKFAAHVEGVFKAAMTSGDLVVKVDYEGWKYELDFGKWTQKNLESGRVRKIERTGPSIAVDAPPGPKSPPEWRWLDDKGAWKDFSAAHASALEVAYHTCPSANPTFSTNFSGTSFGGYSYLFHFGNMTQTNESSKKLRNIARVPHGHPVRTFTEAAPAVAFAAPPLAAAPVPAAVADTPEPATKKCKPDTSDDAGKSAGDGKSVNSMAGGGTKLIKKGRGVVDPHSGMMDSCHIYDDGKRVFQATLNQTNIGQNNNKFYVVQLLEDDKGGKFYVFTRWGRVGVTGQSALDHYTSVLPAQMQFKKKFREKTGNDWDVAETAFTKIDGKYQLMAIDLGDSKDDKPATLGDHMDAAGAEITPSKLPTATQNLVKMICNKADMTASMKELEIDTNKMPLGKISKKQIKDAFAHLKDIENELKKPSPHQATLLSHSSMFYTLIPHDFGMMVPPVIKSLEMLKRKMELLDILGDLEIASKLLAEAKKSGVNPIDQAYDSLNCELAPISHSSPEFLQVQTYVQNTHGKTHTAFRLTVAEVFKVRRSVEELRYKAYEGLHNKQLLWHGSRTTNFMGILSQGLRIAPPEAPVTGYMFGKGIYFADVCSKSANYCNTTPANNNGCLLLCEVALGTTKDYNGAMYMDKPQPGTHSTKGVGRMSPDDGGAAVIDGVKWPCGKMVDTPGVGHTSLLYPEYIVYDVAQCKMKYLVQLKFEYGKK